MKHLYQRPSNILSAAPDSVCAICTQALPPHDLTLDANGLTICTSARWCLIRAIQNASPGQIATMQATASDFALRAAERHMRDAQSLVKLPTMAWVPEIGDDA